jgi:hypothetical protein
MAAKNHLCDASYGLDGKCKFCHAKPCACDEKHPVGGPREPAKIFFCRSSAGPRLASAATDYASRGVEVRIRPINSQWRRDNLLRSLIESIAREETHELLKNGTSPVV